MDYISAKAAAEKWGVSLRRVHQYCEAKRIEGQARVGNAWVIPAAAEKPSDPRQQRQRAPAASEDKLPMPLMSGSFLPGEARKYIRGLQDEELKAVALGEYAYFSGNIAGAIAATERLLDNESVAVRSSAMLVHAFSCIEQNDIRAARDDFRRMQETAAVNAVRPGIDSRERAVCMLISSLTNILLHDRRLPSARRDEAVRYLPEGMKLYACYAMAHQHYLNGDYHRSLGIAETALSLASRSYPISMIYLNLAAAMAYMAVKDTEQASAAFARAWDLAKRDGLIHPFGEHHGLLYGLVEKILTRAEPEQYEKIIGITYRFSDGWRKIHNPDTAETVTDLLTTKEFSIAMLASKDWSNKEIAAYMELSAHTIKHYMSVIYQKLAISNRDELKRYMLR